MSRDPIGDLEPRLHGQPDRQTFLGDQQSLYAGMLNDPVSKRDPDGRLVIADDLVIIAAIGTLVSCVAAELWL